MISGEPSTLNSWVTVQFSVASRCSFGITMRGT